MSICKSCDYYDDCSLSESNEWCYKNSNIDVNKFITLDTDGFDWVSPVELFTKEFKTRIDDGIQQLIEIELGAKIDREEFIKAMNYDRNQFAVGFKSGYAKRDSEIVRCKDCKYCKKAEEKYEGGRFEPTDIVCNVFDIYTHPNEFCSYGKRRETDE